jgi:2-polyprenyl-3-methyl-5-hydroxy-6-metoxy-1,4-benzoquinol methylase
MSEDLEEINCNLCGGTRQDELFDLNPFKLVQCEDCGLSYVSPRFTEDRTLKLYDDSYFTNSGFFSGESSRIYGYSDYEESRENVETMYRKIVGQMERFIKPGELLEIGSAYGYFLNQARKKGWGVSGIELSKNARTACEREFGIQPFASSLKEFDSSEQFDSIVFFDVLEHIHDPMNALRNIHAMLKPGGLLVLAVPNSASWVLKLLGTRWEDLQRANSGEHLYFFNRETLNQILEKTGFEVLEIKTMGRYFKLGHLCHRLQIYNKFIFTSLQRFIETMGLKERNIYVNPFLKLIAFSRKVE